jgi:hypothetical protein
MIQRLFIISLLAGTAILAQAPAAIPPPAVTAAEDVAIIKITPYKPTIQRDPFSAPREMSDGCQLATGSRMGKSQPSPIRPLRSINGK